MRIFLLLLVACFNSAFAIGMGDSITVEWEGKWYDAIVIDQYDAEFRIHYAGYDNSWDEWVTLDRVRIQVEWQGKWYNAVALETSGSRVKIHYTGYDNSWDEWVTLDRIRSY